MFPNAQVNERLAMAGVPARPAARWVQTSLVLSLAGVLLVAIAAASAL
jgi:CHASE3 domain sensor protein